MLNQIIASIALGLIARLIREGDSGVGPGHPGGVPTDPDREELVRLFWDLRYMYLYGLGRVPIPQSALPDLPVPRPGPPRLASPVHERLLFQTLNASLGDPNPQPNLVDMLGAREARLGGARALQARLTSAQQRLTVEIARLESHR